MDATGGLKVSETTSLNGTPYRLEFYDGFGGTELDLSKWVDAYLPQWSSREATRPRYEFRDGQLVLKIEPDQRPWSPEFNGAIRVSSLHTYAAEWTESGVTFFLDGRPVRTVNQSPRYEMQFMLNLYEFSGETSEAELVVDYVAGYRRI